MAASLRAAGMQSFVFSASDVAHDVGASSVTLGGEDLSTCAGIVVKKLGDQSDPWGRMRLHALRALEHSGVRVFSRVDVIDAAMDRYRMTMQLVAAGLPVPRTLAVTSAASLGDAVAELGDCVVKPVYTSKGRGMVRIDARIPGGLAGLPSDMTPCLVQEFVPAPGRDIGATVVGGRFVGAFYRLAAEGAWITTTERGGTYAPCDLPPAGVEVAEAATRAFGLDYTVVDLVECDGGFLVYEVSAFGGFRGLLTATGTDPSIAYSAYVRSQLGA
jgi:ribosomal protein S6--L-glutamate ligase